MRAPCATNVPPISLNNRSPAAHVQAADSALHSQLTVSPSALYAFKLMG